MKKLLLLGTLITLPALAVAQVTSQSTSPAFALGLMLICKWDKTKTHRQVRLYGHGEHEYAELKIVERHSEDMIYQTMVFKSESEESSRKINVILERYSGRIDWNESTGNAFTGYCRLAKERLF